MKFVLQIIFIVALGYTFELFFPWWTIALAAFTGGLIFYTRANFSAGFLAIALLWTGKALLIEYTAAAPLAERVAKIFLLEKPFLFALTAFIGALVGGFAAMCGSALNKKRKKNAYY
jgi:hypothetical protein